MSRYDQIDKLMNNDEFTNKLSEVSTMEEIQSLFADNGVDLTLDEVNEMCMASVNLNGSGELSDEDLENVSGGAISVKKIVKAIVSGWKAGWSAGSKFSDWMYNTFGVN